MLMILNFSYHSQLWISLDFSAGCLPMSCLLILQNLSFSYLIYHSNSLNSIILPFIYLTMSCSHLGVIFDTNLSFAKYISAVSNSCFHNVRDLRHIRNILLIKLLPAPLLLHSFTLKLTIVTLFYSIYLLHKQIIVNLS